MHYRILLIVLTIFLFNYAYGQTWTLTDENSIETKGIRDLTPDKYMVYTVNDDDIKTILWNVPRESVTDVNNSNVLLNIGLPNNSTESFRIVQYNMMEPELAAMYPDIRTYYGISVDNPLKRIRIDYSLHGLRAVIAAPGEDQVFIDHFQRNDRNTKIVYFKSDYKKVPSWGCHISDEHLNHVRNQSAGQRIGDCQLRSYRLAQATTGEYSNYHGATSASQSALVMTAVVNVINRINGVYEAEVAVRLILVANTANIFYYNGSTDPYTNNNGGTMLSENISTCNSVIGSANYDIGHVFSTGGGGVAYLGSVCGTSKAGGVTGSGAPVGDPFTIDYVAHEMGHQFGGNHTQYNNCNRVSAAAREPGSASTIMGYAGICSPNVQSNSDAYFHAYSIQEIKTFLSGNGNSCSQIISSFVNNPPTVTSQSNYSIPISTPFVLTLAASDPQGHPITYAWEQMNSFSNPAQTMPPASTNSTGPMFRSILPTTSPSRYFPPLTNVIANSTNTWQVLPSVARSMSFRGVARDFTGVAGCNSEIDLTVSTVNPSAGAFSITSQNTATTWEQGLSYTVTWNVAGSTASPVSAANVDILLSYDGGNTFPITLLAATPNDGTQSIVVPVGTTSAQGRIMVRGTNHIFYDINNANINIIAPIATFNISANPTTISFCTGGLATSTISVTKVGSFNSPVTLTVSGLPPGAGSTFSLNPVTPDNTSVMSISGPGTPGSYTLVVTGTSGTIIKTVNVNLTVLPLPGATTLNAPADMGTNIPSRPTLTWNAATGASTYDIQMAYDNGFTNTVVNTNVSTTNYIVNTTLYGGTVFYWRVRAINNCGTGAWSAVRSFTVENCWSYPASGLPATIPAGTSPYSLEVNIQDRGVITTTGISAFTGSYAFIPLAQFELVSPNASSTLFWTNPCAKQISDFNIRFADGAASPVYPCPPTDGLEYQPSNSFTTFNGLAMKGKWYININRTTAGSGTIQASEIKICPTDFCKLTVDHDRINGPGSLFAALTCATDGDTIRFAPNIMNDTLSLGTQNLVINKKVVIDCDISRNIHIMSSSPNPTIVNSAPNTGEGLKIRGVHIHSSNAGIGAINNNGLLTLEDVILHKYPGNSTSTITNQSGAVTNLIGNCKIVTD